MSSAPIVDRIRIIPRPSDFLERNVGSSGEVFFSRETNTLRVYSGKVAGGFELARADLANVTITNDDIAWIPYDELTDLPSAAENHGMFAHVHSTGKAYYAHAGQWVELANQEDIGTGGASVDVSATPPAEPQEGNIWFNSDTGRLYIYITDADSSQWVAPVVGTVQSVPDAPQNVFTSIALADSTQFTASGEDTIRFADGPGIEISADPATNTLTISATSGGAAGVDLTAFSVGAEPAAAGDGSLAYNNTTGVFTYTPPDLSSYLTGIAGLNISELTNDSGFITTYAETDTLATVTARGATTTANITVGDLESTGDVTVGGNIITTGSGTPELSSDNEILLTATTRVTISATPIKLASFTTTERNGLVPQNGDLIYNSTDNKFQGYENGAWVNLI